jgi:general stress protein CsbA
MKKKSTIPKFAIRELSGFYLIFILMAVLILLSIIVNLSGPFWIITVPVYFIIIILIVYKIFRKK